ncbi:MAG: hypothetical protein PHI39_06145 [Kiritimatiellae bacterium]|nr:hypothetical protein [Kiritimatiellia bacterium]
MFYSEYYPRAPELFGEVMSNFNDTVAAQIAQTGEDDLGVLIVAFDEGVQLLEAAGAYPALTSVRWYGTEGMAGNAALLANVVAREAARQTRFICSQPAAHTNAKYAEVADWIEAQTGHQPRTFPVISYDTLWLAALALRDTGGTGTVAEVRQAIRDHAAVYAGASGPIEFNTADDRATGEYEFLKIADAGGWEKLSTTVPNAPIVRAPDNLTSNRFDARWRSCAGATNYWLDVAVDADFADCLPGYSNAPVGNGCVEPLEGLTPGQTYFYRVRAGNGAGTSPSSDVASARVWPAEYAVHGVPLWWLARYYTDIEVLTDPDGLALSDTDGDGKQAWEECVAGTSPVDSASVFQVAGTEPASAGGLSIRWWGESGRLYTVSRSGDLSAETWEPESGGGPLPGTGGWMGYTGAMDPAAVSGFFTLQVDLADE